jgi:hypothetical protein
MLPPLFRLSLEAAMNASGRVTTVALLSMMLVAPLVACGRAATPGAPGSTTPTPSPTVTVQEPVPSPSPSRSEAAQPTTPGATTRVVSARVAYQWHWPNDAARPGSVSHVYAVPPVPQLVAIGAGQHARQSGERPFDRMSFTFTTAFPSYRFQFTNELIADGSGVPIPLAGNGVLTVTFDGAQAHTVDGKHSTIRSQPRAQLGFTRMVAYAPAGDFEGVVTYGIGIGWPVANANPQIAVRAYEVQMVTHSGQRLYVVAIDVDATPLG